MKTIMISQPINGKTKKEIIETQTRLTKYLEVQGYEVINTSFEDGIKDETNIKNSSLYYLGNSITNMSRCDAIFFANGWTLARECRVERLTAILYGLEIINESDNNEESNKLS